MNKYHIFPVVLISLFFILSSCSTTRFVEPLEKGEIAVGANAGGPLLVFGGTTIPLPLTGIYAGYGYKEDVTLYGAIHTTSALFSTLQLEAGARKSLHRGSGIFPSLSGAAGINGIVDFRQGNLRLFPEISMNPYWKYGRWKTYLGIQAWFDFYKFAGPNYGYAGFFVPSFGFGQTVDIGSWELALEYKRLGANVPTENSVVNYITFGGLGAQGVYISAHKSFGYEKQK